MEVNIRKLVNELKKTCKNKASVELISDEHIEIKLNKESEEQVYQITLNIDFSNSRGCSISDEYYVTWKELETIGKILRVVGKYVKD
ncbi:hypothetical protein [Ligilactobacillus salivarius]|uniref:hypothetical protein n=1 Tax=Ligilactobacillus salivarius TaxID=1624 RepID=UPI00399119E4